MHFVFHRVGTSKVYVYIHRERCTYVLCSQLSLMPVLTSVQICSLCIYINIHACLYVYIYIPLFIYVYTYICVYVSFGFARAPASTAHRNKDLPWMHAGNGARAVMPWLRCKCDGPRARARTQRNHLPLSHTLSHSLTLSLSSYIHT